MEEKMLLSVQGGRVTPYLFTDKPSILIPFKGDFPIVSEFLTEEFYDQIQKNRYLDECENWVQEAVKKGEKIYTVDSAFRNYISDNNMSVEDFLKLSSKEKTEMLKKFMDSECLSLERLVI